MSVVVAFAIGLDCIIGLGLLAIWRRKRRERKEMMELMRRLVAAVEKMAGL